MRTNYCQILSLISVHIWLIYIRISVFHENKPKLKKKLKQWNQKLNQKWLLKTEILPLHYHCL